MRFAITLLLLSPAVVQGATITLFDLGMETNTVPGPPEPTFSHGISAIGVGTDGATTYIDEAIYSEYIERSHNVYTSGGTTRTVDSPPTTATHPTPWTIRQTFVADASHYVDHVPLRVDSHPDSEIVGDLVESCYLDGKGGEVCVAVVYRSGQPTRTVTITGSAVPVYTLVTLDDQATKENSAFKGGSRFIVAGVAVSMGFLLGVAMGL